MRTLKQTYANTGLATISVANPNLDGTGALETVITSGRSGMEISSITIKATEKTSEGIVRLFIDDGSLISLYKEIYVPAVYPSFVNKSFEITIYDEIVLNSNYKLLASTENNQTFNVIANATEWVICECSSGCSSEQTSYADTGVVTIKEGNENLDGSGAMGLLLTANSGSILVGGTVLYKVNIKALESTNEGMIRLFLGNGENKYLLTEIKVPATTLTELQPSFRTECFLNFYLQSGYSVYASTQNSERFNIMITAVGLVNCKC